MPDALYIPGAPGLGRPLKDNLSDPRCSAQHRPLPHRAASRSIAQHRREMALAGVSHNVNRAEGRGAAHPSADCAFR